MWRELAADLVIFHRGRRARAVALFAIGTAVVLVALRRPVLLVDQPMTHDGHALVALDLALTRVWCGAGSAFPLDYRIPHWVRDHPETRFTPLKELAVTLAGSIDQYCARINQPFINNENSLTVIEAAVLRIDPDVSAVGLGRWLNALRVGIIVGFAAVLVAAGLSAGAGMAVVLAGLVVLRANVELVHSLYPFLFALVLLSVAWYGVSIDALRGRNRWRLIPAALVGGVLAGLSVNMRSSHLPVYVAMFAMFLGFVWREWRSRLTPRDRRVPLAVSLVAFAAGFMGFQWAAITRHQPDGMVYSASYHTVAHPLVLSVAVPPSDLSEREGIVWSDNAGLRLARKMDPEAIYLGPGYDAALFKYYGYLWRTYPREMARLYVRKFAMAGTDMITILRSNVGWPGRIERLVLKPWAYLSNGIVLLTLFAAVAVTPLLLASAGPFAVMLALSSGAAALLLVESAVIMPAYVPSYHNYLVMYVFLLPILAAQAVGNAIISLAPSPRRSAARKTELYFESISRDFAERMNPFDLGARLAWFDRVLAAHDPAGRRGLDVGAGLGQFSEVARRRGAWIVPLDIAPTLVRDLRGVFGRATRASATSLPFGNGQFDFVISSECIEHTANPRQAVLEMVRVLKPGGVLYLTTPNLVWRWSVWIAEALGLRRFEGVENWISRRALHRTILDAGAEVVDEAGLHIAPFQLRALHPLLRFVNAHAQWLKPIMINQCWVARKADSA